MNRDPSEKIVAMIEHQKTIFVATEKQVFYMEGGELRPVSMTGNDFERERAPESPEDLVPCTAPELVPLDGPEDLVVRGFFWVRSGHGDPPFAVSSIRDNQVSFGTDLWGGWDWLFDEGYEYAAALDGPWHKFAKEKGDARPTTF